jgi:hypothetical protein
MRLIAPLNASVHLANVARTRRGTAEVGSRSPLAWVQEVPGSNPGCPTKFLKHLQSEHPSDPAFWSPFGVQNGLQPRCFGRFDHHYQVGLPSLGRAPVAVWTQTQAAVSQIRKTGPNPPGLSTPIKTRQATRHFPARNPTFGGSGGPEGIARVWSFSMAPSPSSGVDSVTRLKSMSTRPKRS